jgi:uncharacterized protein YegJ (DUF2314 family)
MRVTRPILATLTALALIATGPGAMAQANGKGAQATGQGVADGSSQAPAVMVPTEDKAMAAAIAEARRTLPVFWRMYDAPPAGTGNYQVNVALPSDGGGLEYIWIEVKGHTPTTVTGRIDNPPDHLHGMAYNQVITVSTETIADWMYVKDDKLWGNFTTRVMLKYSPPEVAEQMNAVLSPTPMDSGRP